MKISELIEKLEEIKEEQDDRDINVTYRTDDYFRDVGLLTYYPPTHGEEERVEIH